MDPAEESEIGRRKLVIVGDPGCGKVYLLFLS
jgi:GTPase SAR1 family protein